MLCGFDKKLREGGREGERERRVNEGARDFTVIPKEKAMWAETVKPYPIEAATEVKMC